MSNSYVTQLVYFSGSCHITFVWSFFYNERVFVYTLFRSLSNKFSNMARFPSYNVVMYFFWYRDSAVFLFFFGFVFVQTIFVENSNISSSVDHSKILTRSDLMGTPFGTILTRVRIGYCAKNDAYLKVIIMTHVCSGNPTPVLKHMSCLWGVFMACSRSEVETWCGVIGYCKRERKREGCIDIWPPHLINISLRFTEKCSERI